MADERDKAPVEWDRLHPSRDFRELFRYRRGDELRVYQLRVVPGGAELWQMTATAGNPATPLKEDDFTSPDDVIQTLEELKLRLKAGGWQELDDR
jgi:hypothetical protein